MRVYLDFSRKVVYFDATGGDLGPTTTAGHVGTIFARDYPELLEGREGWKFQFHPESGDRGCAGFAENEDKIVDLDRNSWDEVAHTIARLINAGPVQKCCANCGTCAGCGHRS